MSGLFDPVGGEPLRDALGHLQNSINASRAAAQNAAMHQSIRAGNAELQRISSLLTYQIKQQEEERARIRSLPQCPYCGGRIEAKFSVCQHCKHTIHWLFGMFPHMDGCRDEIYNKVENILAQSFIDASNYVQEEEISEQLIKQKEQDEQRKQLRLAIAVAFVFIALIVVLLVTGPNV